MKVLFYTPGWPIEDFSNGIVSYVDRLLPELDKRGIRTRLVAGSLGAHHQGDAVASAQLGPSLVHWDVWELRCCSGQRPIWSRSI
jgi:hypothetical protein